MKGFFFGLIALLFLAACSQETKSEKTSTENTTTSKDSSKETVNSNADEPLSEKGPLGTWIDFKTGEVMVFTQDKVYWANRAGVKMTELKIKSKDDGKIGVYFENKADKIYDMVYTSGAKTMECRSASQKLNDYEWISENLDPSKNFESMQEAIGFSEDAPMKYALHNKLKTTEDPRLLMLYLHTPFKYWTSYFEKKDVDEGNFMKCYGGVKLKLKNGNSLALIGGEAAGDMQYYCHYATLAFNTDYLDNQNYYLQHHWKSKKCDNPDRWKITKMYLDKNNGDLMIDLEIKDVFDDFDDMDNGRAAEEGRPLRTKETLMVKKTIRVTANPNQQGLKTEKEEKIKLNK